ncbi:MAG: crossover junction endodeoxyribonuclease RuvC [Candidatus Peribacteraceae bacterium]|nr:crossover junction endodeoxyribonuclease RuvC [Candidatus Peribacteraceae bacterium]
MRVLGIDPGLATIGLGVVDSASPSDIRAVEWLVLRTKPGRPLADRLREIHADFSEYLAECKPDLAVIERQFFAKNETTAMDVSHARGCLLLALAQHDIPHLEPTPLQLKSAVTGDGKASKAQIQDMMALMLRLETKPTPDDAADALALAVYGALRANDPATALVLP